MAEPLAVSEIAFDPQHPSVPIAVVEVWQSYYKTCHHTLFSPQQPRTGQRYRVTGHIDFSGRCPPCQAERANAKDAAKAGKR